MTGTEPQFGKMEKFWRGWWMWLHSSVKVPNADKQYTQKWLKSCVLCYAYFTTIFKNLVKIVIKNILPWLGQQSEGHRNVDLSGSQAGRRC